MIPRPQEGIAEFLLWTRTFVDRALGEHELREEMDRIGSGEPVLRNIDGQLREAARWDQVVRSERDEQRRATTRIEEAFAAADKPYMRLVELLRALFVNDIERSNRFELNRPRLRSQSGALRQARALYHMVLSDEGAVAATEARGLRRGQIEVDAALYDEVERAIGARAAESDDVREALLKRDEALDALDTSVREVVGVMRAMWRDRPEWLIRLGID